MDKEIEEYVKRKRNINHLIKLNCLLWIVNILINIF